MRYSSWHRRETTIMPAHNRSFLILVLISVSILGIFTLCYSHFGDEILSIDNGQVETFSQIQPDLSSVPVIFVGEIHSDIHHHDLQLRIIKALHESDIPVTIAMEMVDREDQDPLDKWIEGGLNEGEFRKTFERNWPASWDLYRSIFIFAREHKIPMLGLNVPDEITEQVAREGFSSLSSEQLEKLPGVACNVDEEYMKIMRMAVKMHGKDADGANFTNFCEAQMVWDTTMAQTIIDYSERMRDHRVVVLAGNIHAWKYGIPEQVRRKAPSIPYRVVLPEIPFNQTRDNISTDRADYLWLAPSSSE
jgi:uncharacterized iron-regulated protein